MTEPCKIKWEYFKSDKPNYEIQTSPTNTTVKLYGQIETCGSSHQVEFTFTTPKGPIELYSKKVTKDGYFETFVTLTLENCSTGECTATATYPTDPPNSTWIPAEPVKFTVEEK